MFERFTAAARASVVAAQEQARDLGHGQIGVEHLALGLLLADPPGPAAAMLSEAGVDAAALRREVASGGGWDTVALSSIGIDLAEVRRRAEAAFGPGALGAPRPRRGLLRRAQGGHLPLTAGAKRVLQQSLRETVALRHTSIGGEHLLLGLLGDGQAVDGLRLAGLTVDPAELRVRVLAALRHAA